MDWGVVRVGHERRLAEFAIAFTAVLAMGLSAAPALADTLQGTTMSGGVPVSVFVSVTGANGQAATTSEASGAFSVTLPAGSYTVDADGPGYKAASEPVNVSGTTSTTLALTRTSTVFSPLPVFGSAVQGVAAGGTPGVFYAWDNVVPQLFRTDDYGGSWLPVTSGYDDATNGLPKNFVPRHFTTNAIVATSGFPGEVAMFLQSGPMSWSVYYSTDYGVIWKQIANAPVNAAAGGPGTPGSLYWGHVAGSTDVMVEQLGTTDYVADMSAASPSFTPMTTPYTPASSDIMTVADGANQPWVAVAHADGSVDIYPLTTALTVPGTPTATATGFPSNPVQLGFGGMSSAGFPPSALLATAGGGQPGAGATVAMALESPAGSDTFATPATATEPAMGMQIPACGGINTGPGNIGLAVAPNSDTSGGAGFTGSCYAQDSGSSLTLDSDYLNVNYDNGGFAFDSGYNGSSDPVILVAQSDSGYGVVKSAAVGGDGAPSFPLTQDASAGTGASAGGIAVSGITTAIADDTAFGPAGVNDVATAVDPSGGDVSLASDNGGASTNVAVNDGAVSTAWWQGASGSWLVFGTTDQFGSPTHLISALQNWSSATPELSAPNLQGSDPTSLGECSNQFRSVWVDTLAPVAGADEFFDGQTMYCGGNTPTGGEVRLLTITPGSPPSVGTDTQIAASQVTSPVADLAYCPAAGSASSIADTLFIAEGHPHYAIANGNQAGALLRVSGATSGSPTVTKVASVPTPGSVNVVRADCATGTVYAGVGDIGGQSQAGAVYASTDGGVTFAATTTPCGFVPGGVSALAINPSNDNDITVAAGQQGVVCSSSDGGMTWTTENDPTTSGFDFSTLGIFDLEIPPPIITAGDIGFFKPLAVTASDALAATGGGEFAANVRITPPAAAPTVTSFSISPKHFRVSKKPTAITASRHKKAKGPRGATFHYRLSIAASVKIEIEEALAGAKVRGKCVAVTRKIARHRYPHCTRYKVKGTLSRTGKAGANKLLFSGRIGSRALPAGSYLASIVGTANSKSSKPRKTRFTILK